MSIIVYTTIFGESDSLKPAPVGADHCVCFTDGEHEDPKGWDLQPIPQAYVAHFPDPRRRAWHIRAWPVHLFSHWDRLVWIDASFTLTDLPLVLAHTGSADIAALRHHNRTSCYAEGKEIIRIGQAHEADVVHQLDTYAKAGFHPQHLSTSCILVRTQTAAVEAFNKTWLQEFTIHRGDNTQLSIDYAAWKNGLEIKALQGSYRGTPYGVYDKTDHKQRRKPYAK